MRWIDPLVNVATLHSFRFTPHAGSTLKSLLATSFLIVYPHARGDRPIRTGLQDCRSPFTHMRGIDPLSVMP